MLINKITLINYEITIKYNYCIKTIYNYLASNCDQIPFYYCMFLDHGSALYSLSILYCIAIRSFQVMHNYLKFRILSRLL